MAPAISEPLPDTIRDVKQLEEMLSRPTPEVIATMGRLEGDILILGVSGKIGPSMALMAKRASDAAGKRRRIIGVDIFPTPGLQEQLQSQGIETIKSEMLDREKLAALPDAPNVLYLAAMKFGTLNQEAVTWARNVYLPGLVSERYSKSRIVAFSTGNIYGLSPVARGGSLETDEPAPVGDYAMSCLGRERMFTYFSQTKGIPVTLIRLNYANEVRYGVLVDLAQKVMAGETIDLSMGHFNVIWQGDSNTVVLRALEQATSPPTIINITGPQILSVRKVVEQFGQLLQKPVKTVGTEAPDALLNNSEKAYKLFGRPAVSEDQLIRWVAGWQKMGGPMLGKPTHFEARDGKY